MSFITSVLQSLSFNPSTMFRAFSSLAFRAPSVSRLSHLNVGAIRYMSDVINTGTVKWFDTKKGFGFIVPDDGSEDIFVHQSAIHSEGFRSLADGETVEFSVFKDDNGRSKAENVTGPMGAYVQGAPRSPRMYSENSFGGGDGGFGGGGRGGFGRGGRDM